MRYRSKAKVNTPFIFLRSIRVNRHSFSVSPPLAPAHVVADTRSECGSIVAHTKGPHNIRRHVVNLSALSAVSFPSLAFGCGLFTDCSDFSLPRLHHSPAIDYSHTILSRKFIRLPSHFPICMRYAQCNGLASLSLSRCSVKRAEANDISDALRFHYPIVLKMLISRERLSEHCSTFFRLFLRSAFAH